MVTEVGEPAVVGCAADVGNRSPGQLAMVQEIVSVPATNRLIPSSWGAEKVSVVVSVNWNRKTVAFENVPEGPFKGLVRHTAEVQVAGVGPAPEAKKPGIVFRFVLWRPDLSQPRRIGGEALG
jgi:hypothetical protein